MNLQFYLAILAGLAAANPAADKNNPLSTAKRAFSLPFNCNTDADDGRLRRKIEKYPCTSSVGNLCVQGYCEYYVSLSIHVI